MTVDALEQLASKVGQDQDGRCCEVVLIESVAPGLPHLISVNDPLLGEPSQGPADTLHGAASHHALELTGGEPGVGSCQRSEHVTIKGRRDHRKRALKLHGSALQRPK